MSEFSTPSEPRAEKARLRQQMRAARRLIGRSARAQASSEVLVHALSTDLFASGRHVAAYCATGCELSLKPLLDLMLARGVFVYLPKVVRRQSGEMQFLRYHGQAHLEPAHFGILAPISILEDAIAAAELDLILLPLLAFDARGYRLGQGGGYYDRYLQALGKTKPLRVGFAFHFQAVEQLPTESFDEKLHAAITECGVVWFVTNQQGACSP